MRPRDIADLLALAALWGASFVFIRMGAHEFGPFALSALRVSIASVVLLPILLNRDLVPVLRRHWKPILIVGVINSALPFLLFSYAALSITAGLSSIFNATSPLWGALVARIWLRDHLTPLRVVGLVIGFAGVLWLAWSNVNHAAGFKPGGTGWAVVACIGAALLYGISASFTKRRLSGVAPLAVATGSQVFAAAALAVPAVLWWPQTAPSATAWSAVLLLGVFGTGVAYILYFRLIANAGPANAIAVTFLIPVFAVVWGWMFLAEQINAVMVIGCVVILLGTGLTTGLLRLPGWTRACSH